MLLSCATKMIKMFEKLFSVPVSTQWRPQRNRDQPADPPCNCSLSFVLHHSLRLLSILAETFVALLYPYFPVTRCSLGNMAEWLQAGGCLGLPGRVVRVVCGFRVSRFVRRQWSEVLVLCPVGVERSPVLAGSALE